MERTQGERLAYIREIRGLSQSKLAELAGVSRGVIQNIEYDRAKTMPAVITSICSALEIREEWLINGTGPAETPPAKPNIILQEVYNCISDMSDPELTFIRDIVKSMKKNLVPREGE